MRLYVEKVIKFDGAGRFLLSIDHDDHHISMRHISGKYPEAPDVIDLLLSDSDVREEIDWAVNDYERKRPISIATYDGVSGCRSIKIYVSMSDTISIKHGEDWKYAAKIAITCYGKISADSTLFSARGIFSGDLADLLYTGGLNEYTKRHHWCYVKPRPPMRPTTSICGQGYTGGEPVIDRPTLGYRDTYTSITE